MSEKSSRKKLRGVCCFLEHEGKFLILLRHPDKTDGNVWGLPAGKVEKNETDEEAAIREVWEETGYRAEKKHLRLLGDYVFEFPDLYLEFPAYSLKLAKPFTAQYRKDEHTEARWVTAEECYAMDNLIRGFHDLLRRTGHIKKSL